MSVFTCVVSLSSSSSSSLKIELYCGRLKSDNHVNSRNRLIFCFDFQKAFELSSLFDIT